MQPAYTLLTAGYPILLRRSPVPRILHRASKLILYKRHPAPPPQQHRCSRGREVRSQADAMHVM